MLLLNVSWQKEWKKNEQLTNKCEMGAKKMGTKV